MIEPTTNAEPYIVFELAGTAYGLRSRDVRHMEMIEHVTPVPNAAHFVEGVVFSRGQVIPVVSLRAWFGLERAPYDLRKRLLVVQNEQRTMGLADSAREFLALPADAIQPPHEAINGLSGRYPEGIATLGERIVLILNLAETLNFDTKKQ